MGRVCNNIFGGLLQIKIKFDKSEQQAITLEPKI